MVDNVSCELMMEGEVVRVWVDDSENYSWIVSKSDRWWVSKRGHRGNASASEPGKTDSEDWCPT